MSKGKTGVSEQISSVSGQKMPVSGLKSPVSIVGLSVEKTKKLFDVRVTCLAVLTGRRRFGRNPTDRE